MHIELFSQQLFVRLYSKVILTTVYYLRLMSIVKFESIANEQSLSILIILLINVFVEIFRFETGLTTVENNMTRTIYDRCYSLTEMFKSNETRCFALSIALRPPHTL